VLVLRVTAVGSNAPAALAQPTLLRFVVPPLTALEKKQALLQAGLALPEVSTEVRAREGGLVKGLG
jgi:hypothetical protein